MLSPKTVSDYRDLTSRSSDSFIDLINIRMAEPISDEFNYNILKVETVDCAPISAYTEECSSDDFSYVALTTLNSRAADWEKKEGWRVKYIAEWSGNDAMDWVFDEVRSKGYSPPEFPIYLFKDTTGLSLMNMTKDTFCDFLQRANIDRNTAEYFGYMLFESLQERIVERRKYDPCNEESVVPVPVIDRFTNDIESIHLSKENAQDSCTYLDLDRIPTTNHEPQYNNNNTHYQAWDYDSNEYDFMHESPSSKPSLESDSEKSVELSGYVKVKRPPGRPKGSGKKVHKRVKNVSVPEFLRDLLLNPKYCPRIIKWEDYNKGKFRFVRPDEVSRIWGTKRNNSKMSFEKFSRAMRYHYKQSVLVSVPEARLVYQFGPKAPVYLTEDPNFEVTAYTNGS